MFLVLFGAREAGCFRELAVLNALTILDKFHCIRNGMWCLYRIVMWNTAALYCTSHTLQVSCASEGNVTITVGQTRILCQSAGQEVRWWSLC